MAEADDDHDAIERAAELLRHARHVVVFTGAGVSAESGIPTFRDALTGLWERFDASDLASEDAFRRDPALVWGWYEWRRMMVMRAQPNAAHRAIAALADKAPRLTLVTQNVDDLHERAGSVGPIHLHGSLFTPRCFQCAGSFAFRADVPDEPQGGRRLPPPSCDQCGGLVRPGVVWFGEPLPEAALAAAFDAARACDVLISVGTSSVVFPAAQVPVDAHRAGAKVVQVNPNATGLDAMADVKFAGNRSGNTAPVTGESASLTVQVPRRPSQKAPRGSIMAIDAGTRIDERIARAVDDRLPHATSSGKARRKRGVLAVSADYDARTKRLRIELVSGVGVSIPVSKLQGLAEAPASVIKTVRIEGGGYGLHWALLDLDLAVPDLIAGCFGSRAWMSALARQGGKARTTAKRRAARENGKKGGRPRRRAREPAARALTSR